MKRNRRYYDSQSPKDVAALAHERIDASDKRLRRIEIAVYGFYVALVLLGSLIDKHLIEVVAQAQASGVETHDNH